MLSYDGFTEKLAERGLTKTELGRILGISSRTMAKIAKGERLSRGVLNRMAEYLGCTAEDLCREISPNPLLQALRDEKASHLSGGIYHELQVRMTYNSNHIEGSILTEEQTRLIFETRTIGAANDVPVDDILETIHHFRAIDWAIDTADEQITAEHIKHFHWLLKHDTNDAALPWFAVGDYKRRPNMMGGRETTAPHEVPAAMEALLAAYTRKPQVGMEDIFAFHAEFERIHPFQDGNGRVGRLIALKECLRFDIVPFIIEDRKKAYYYQGLTKWPEEPERLIDTCLDGQDTMRALLRSLGIPETK